MARRRLVSLLRPIHGWRQPVELRADRIGQTARARLGGLDDPGLADLISEIDGGAPIHRGNRVRLFTDGAMAMAAMLEAVADARCELLCEAYTFLDDAVGHGFADSFAEAADRGVRVCVLADAWGSLETASEFWRDLERRGVEARLFHRLFRHLWWQPFRDHRKILVADRRLAFTGGMNIADAYSGSASSLRREERMRDSHLEIAGPAAVEMAAVFAESWERGGGRTLDPEPELEEVAGTGEDGARVHVLDSRPGRGHRETAAVLAAVASLAEKRLWLTNAYFAPGRLAVRLLIAAAGRGVDVRLLLPGHTDVPLVRHAGHGWYRRLLANGVRVFEFLPAILHAKTLVADGELSIVGSTNLDARSFRFNSECNAVVLDRGLASDLEAAFEHDLLESREIAPGPWRRRGLVHRTGDRTARWLSPLL